MCLFICLLFSLIIILFRCCIMKSFLIDTIHVEAKSIPLGNIFMGKEKIGSSNDALTKCEVNLSDSTDEMIWKVLFGCGTQNW